MLITRSIIFALLRWIGRMKSASSILKVWQVERLFRSSIRLHHTGLIKDQLMLT